MKVKCNNCGWEGEDKHLYLVMTDIHDPKEVPVAVEGDCGFIKVLNEKVFKTMENEDKEFFNGCPNCYNYKYLMNMPYNEEEKGIEMLEDERQTDYSYLKIDEDATLHETDGN